MPKLRKRENKRIGYYSFEYRRLGKRSILDESFIFSTSVEKNQLNANKFGEFAIFNADLLKDKGKAEKYFIKAINEDPQNSFWIGNYAIFLHFYKREIELAQKYYELSIKTYDDDPFLLFNYCILLIFEKKNYTKAEKLLKKIIAIDSDYPKYQCTYAGFLYKIKKEYKKAEKYFNKIIDKFSKNPQCLANYAQFKILEKDFVTAKDIIDRAFKMDLTDDTKLELWFYRYAHFKEWQEKAEFEMNKLIQAGVKTSAWGLQQNVVLSLFLGHDYPEKVREYAAKIEGFYRI